MKLTPEQRLAAVRAAHDQVRAELREQNRRFAQDVDPVLRKVFGMSEPEEWILEGVDLDD